MAESPETPSGFTIKKSVDESWKDSIEKEKESDSSPETPKIPAEGRFAFFISSLAMQALMFMGEIENPATGAKAVDLPQAQHLIEILEMLSDKTKNNLTKEESLVMEEALYVLRIKFVEKKQGLS